MRAIIFIGTGKISYGKLAQALDHGALTVQIAGDFDDAMTRVQQVAKKLGIYLVKHHAARTLFQVERVRQPDP